MKNNLAIFSQARINSFRCKNKMIRKFGNSTLLDILLNKLNSKELNKFEVYIAVGERKITKISEKYKNLNTIYRNKLSLNSDNSKRCF